MMTMRLGPDKTVLIGEEKKTPLMRRPGIMAERWRTDILKNIIFISDNNCIL